MPNDRVINFSAGPATLPLPVLEQAQRELVAQVGVLERSWRDRLSAIGDRRLRSDALAWDVLDMIPRHPTLTSPSVARELGVTGKAATSALGTLAAAGILTEYGTLREGRGQPPKLYVSVELLGLVGASPLR